MARARASQGPTSMFQRQTEIMKHCFVAWAAALLLFGVCGETEAYRMILRREPPPAGPPVQ